jgi:hypothetical protein
VVAPLQSSRESIDFVAPPWEQAHAPAATEPLSVGGDWLGTLRTSLAPKTSLAPDDDRSAEEQHPPAQGPDQAADNILRAASGHQASNRQSTTNSQSNSFAGPFGLSEEALARLEAGLRAQREHLLARSAELATAPGICPIDDDEAYPGPDKVSLAPTLAALRTSDTPQRLPRAAQLHSSRGLSTADNEVHARTPDRRASEPLASSFSATDRRRNWGLLLVISISTIIAALIAGTFQATERTSINADVIEPALTKAIAPELPSAAPENNQLSNEPAASRQIGVEHQAATSTAPGAPAQPAAPIPASADPVVSKQSNVPATIVPPSGGDTSSPSSHRSRKATKAQRPQARLPSPG